MRTERALSPAARASRAPDPSRVLVIGCGALGRELVAVIDQAGLSNVDLTCLPATLHNRPGGIPAAVRGRIRAARPRYDRIFIAYADCGTGGLLDLALAEEGVERLPGAHCYEVYAGAADFAAITDEDPATFFLTDFLARNFDRLVIKGLGLDRHPELRPTYFGNYHRLVYLAQTDDPALVRAARRAARRLGLTYELRRTGYGDLAASLAVAASAGVGAGSGPVASGATTARKAVRSSRGEADSLLPGQRMTPQARPPAQATRSRPGLPGVSAESSALLPGRQRPSETLPGQQRSGRRRRSGMSSGTITPRGGLASDAGTSRAHAGTSRAHAGTSRAH